MKLPNIIDLILEGKALNFTNLGIGRDWPEVPMPERIQEAELDLADEPLDDQERFENKNPEE